jgi:hypothetical protein
MDNLPFGKDRRPEYPEVEGRRKLNEKERAELVRRQDGKCAGCGIAPRHGWEADHGKALWKGDTDQSDLTTWQAFGSHKDCGCHAAKTAEEARERAQMRRLRGETGQAKRRKERGGSMIKSASKIQSRGFNKTLRRKMDGTTEQK